LKTKSITYFCFLLFFIYFFLVFKTNFYGPDKPIYYAYTESLVEDGDLNVVNNIDSSDRHYFPSGVMEISKTYNLPDFHNHGGVVFWIPVYVYAKVVYHFIEKFNILDLTTYGYKRFAECFMSFSTIVFGFFVLFLTYMFCRAFFSNKISFFSILVICFGTPFFYYLLFETGNANIIASFFSILSIWAASYIIGEKKLHWFAYGLFFGICVVVKIDLWFQIFFIIPFFIILFINKRIRLINGINFAIGLIPGVLSLSVNNYIKYGVFGIREFGLLNVKDCYFLDQLFSSYHGFFYTSPIFFICMLGLILLIVDFLKKFKPITKLQYKPENLFILLLSLYLVIKIILLGYRYAWGGGTCGARPLLTEFPILVILYAYALRVQKRLFKYCFAFVSLIFVFWNLLIVSEYVSKVDLGYIFQMPKLSIRIGVLKNVLIPLFQHKDLSLKLILCFFPMLLVLGVVFYLIMFSKKIYSFSWYPKNNTNIFKIFFVFTLCLNVSYVGITFSNIYNNKKNVEKMKKDGLFNNIKILIPQDFEKNENLGAMNEMIEYFTLKDDQERVYRIERQKQEIYGKN